MIKLCSVRGLVSALVLSAAAAVGAAHAETNLVIVSWGGSYTEAQKKAFFEPFMQANPDIKITVEDSAFEALGKLRAQKQAGNTTWDVIDMTVGDTIIACDENLIMSVNQEELLAPAPDGTPAADDFLPGTLKPGGTECYSPQILGNVMFAVRSDAWGGNVPTNIADVFDLKKFPGKRALSKEPSYNLEWALLADGVAADDVYKVLSTPEGVDRAFKQLDKIKDQVIWWSAGAQPPQLLADNEVAIASGYVTRFFQAIEADKKPIALLWDMQQLDAAGWVIPSGSKNVDAAMKFVRYATDTQRMADLTKFAPLGPTRKSALPLIGKHAELGVEMAPYVPTNAKYAARSFHFDPIWWADHRADMEKRFNTWLSQ